jgi:hypothetical protein
MLPRKAELFSRAEYAPDYEPNLDYCRLRRDLSVPKLSTMVGRTWAKKKVLTYNEDYIVESFVKTGSNFYRNSRGFNLSKGESRDWECPLPAFMSRRVGSRAALKQLNEKSLQLNNFCNSRFLSTRSDFNRPACEPAHHEEDDI